MRSGETNAGAVGRQRRGRLHPLPVALCALHLTTTRLWSICILVGLGMWKDDMWSAAHMIICTAFVVALAALVSSPRPQRRSASIKRKSALSSPSIFRNRYSSELASKAQALAIFRWF
eukprot:1999870-Pleurochrysis_carterae.AAC.1